MLQTPVNPSRARKAWFAFLALVVFTQAAHVVEHVAQLVQIHGLGIPKPDAHGLLGHVFDQEWVHFGWDAWLLFAGLALIVPLRRHPALLVFIPITVWHGFEHVFIISDYLRSGTEGGPGLLARGGLIAGGLPLTRPQLHFLYNFAQELLLVSMMVTAVRAWRPKLSWFLPVRTARAPVQQDSAAA